MRDGKTKRAGQLTLLGHSEARLPASPAEARLETFPNPAPRRNYRIHFETDDFTSVCPVTGQPDFAQDRYRLRAGPSLRREQVTEILSRLVSQRARVQRSRHKPHSRRFRESLRAARSDRDRAILRARRNRADRARRVSGQEMHWKRRSHRADTTFTTQLQTENCLRVLCGLSAKSQCKCK